LVVPPGLPLERHPHTGDVRNPRISTVVDAGRCDQMPWSHAGQDVRPGLRAAPQADDTALGKLVIFRTIDGVSRDVVSAGRRP
jgi:hypothetical protein